MYIDGWLEKVVRRIQEEWKRKWKKALLCHPALSGFDVSLLYLSKTLYLSLYFSYRNA
jgi:hypothetical protein